MRKRKNVDKIIFAFILEILFLLTILSFYIKKDFSDVSFEQLIYSMQTATGTGYDVIKDGFIYVFPRLLCLNLFIYLLYFINKNKKYNVICNLKFKNKKFQFNLTCPRRLNRVILYSLLFLSLIITIFFNIGFIDYLTIKDNHFFDKYYVSPKNVNIEVPKEKNNLILIYVESLETSLLSSENGGNFNESVIPNLEKLAKENLNFSNNSKIGGASMAYGASWTVAGIVASSSGIPLKIGSSDGNLYWDYNGSYLPGAYSLGEVLKNNGYSNYFILGSNSTFGGRSLYFSQHGNYDIYDYGYAINKKWIDKNYFEWWGYEDSKLYNFSKKQLTRISKNNKPFNFTILTADTHFTDGYVDKSCKEKYDEKYLNSYSCTDSMLYEFINWIKEQDFYKNTTIVIIGDHLSMQKNFKQMYDNNNYERKIYNTFINSRVKTKNTNNRNFTSFDYYPTILSSLGFKINGNQLGLGVNLFSNKKTLAEKMGFEKFNNGLKEKSNYYNNYISENIQFSTKK